MNAARDNAIANALTDRLVQRALLLTSQVLARIIDEGECLSPSAIHSVRVATKRLRAGWRLLRPVLPSNASAQADARLRALHHALAAERATFVRVGTVERLQSATDSEELQAVWLAVAVALQDGPPFPTPPAAQTAVASPAAGNLRALVNAAQPPTAAVPAAHAGATELIAQTFRAESRAWRELNAVVAGADLLPALRKSYRRARRAARAISLRNADAFHVWRLRLKRLQHQLDLLGIAEAVPAALRGQWADISDQLGRLQDLHDLASHAAALRLAPEAARLFAQRVRMEQRHLQRRLKRRSAAAFDLSSRAFVSLLAAAPSITPSSVVGPRLRKS